MVEKTVRVKKDMLLRGRCRNVTMERSEDEKSNGPRISDSELCEQYHKQIYIF